MWKCPKCNREFQKVNQDHFCGNTPITIDEYIALQPENVQLFLKQVRDVIHNSIPEAQEKISWRMPTYYKEHNIIHFAAFKIHIGIYPGPEAIEHFANELIGYKTSKGAIQVPYSNNLPIDLIMKIACWCYETENHQ